MLFDVELIEASADNISVRWRFPAPSLELAGARPFRLPAAVRLLAWEASLDEADALKVSSEETARACSAN
jgi:hypothetical protein